MENPIGNFDGNSSFLLTVSLDGDQIYTSNLDLEQLAAIPTIEVNLKG